MLSFKWERTKSLGTQTTRKAILSSKTKIMIFPFRSGGRGTREDMGDSTKILITEYGKVNLARGP